MEGMGMSDEIDNVEWLRKSSSEEWCSGALNKCADEIERLREEVERLKSEESSNDVLLEYAQAETQRLREENARLRAALKPFAALWDVEEPYRVGGLYTLRVKYEDVRAAAAAIREGGKDETL